MKMQASEILEYIAAARACSKAAHAPRHIIRRHSGLSVVSEIVDGDVVVVRDIMAPRRTADSIRVDTYAGQEISMAMEHINRAAAIMRKNDFLAPDAQEIVADLIERAFMWTEELPDRKPSIWARLFGKVAY
jgi:hypothetical protein